LKSFAKHALLSFLNLCGSLLKRLESFFIKSIHPSQRPKARKQLPRVKDKTDVAPRKAKDNPWTAKQRLAVAANKILNPSDPGVSKTDNSKEMEPLRAQNREASHQNRVSRDKACHLARVLAGLRAT